MFLKNTKKNAETYHWFFFNFIFLNEILPESQASYNKFQLEAIFFICYKTLGKTADVSTDRLLIIVARKVLP